MGWIYPHGLILRATGRIRYTQYIWLGLDCLWDCMKTQSASQARMTWATAQGYQIVDGARLGYQGMYEQQTAFGFWGLVMN